jgi:hypothetical protein
VCVCVCVCVCVIWCPKPKKTGKRASARPERTHGGCSGCSISKPKQEKRANGARPAREDNSRWVFIKTKKNGEDNSRWVLDPIVHFSIRIFLNDISVTLRERRAQP